MKKISIFIVILFISLGGKAQATIKPDTIGPIALDSDSIVGLNYELKFDFDKYGIDSLKEKITGERQDDVKLDRTKIVSIKRNSTTLTFKFVNINKDNCESAKKRLNQGCDLKVGGIVRIHVSFNVVVNTDAERVRAAESTDAIAKEGEEADVSIQQDSINCVMRGNLSLIQNELKITQYAAVVIGVILFILIIVLSKYKVKGRFVKDFNKRNLSVDELFTTINGKIQSLEEADKGIIEELRKIKEPPVSNANEGNPSVQRTNSEPIQEPSEEVVTHIKTPSKGYVAEPKIDGILDKDIKSECDEYCIYEVNYISTNKAHYFINKDTKALQNIISQAYMLGNYNDETKGQQATEAETVDYGILQKDEGGHWIVVKPMKFTIK